MRRPSLTRIMLCTMLSALAVLAGCQSSQRTQGNQPLHPTPTQPDAQGRYERDNAPTAAQMQELLGRLQTLELDNAHLKKRLSDQYMEAVAQNQARLEAERRQPRPVPGPASNTQPQANTGQAQIAEPANASAPADPRTLTQSDLLEALINRIAQGNDPDRVKALMAAAVSLASDHKQMDPRLLDALDPKTREQVARFHQMVAVAFDELAADAKGTLNRREMIEKIDGVFGAQPLQIEAFELCRRVDSYGVYEPFASTRFLAGRKNRVLVYVELENFKHKALEDGGYEVRLEQSIELFDVTGETTVWRQGPEQLTDVSRNKRRDFFIVYPIDLPARLPAGGYRMKVRIADKHTGSLCEQTMHDIQIVADQSLVGGR